MVRREPSRLRKILQEPPLRRVDGRKRKIGTKSRRYNSFTSVHNKKIEATCNSQAKLTTSTGTAAFIDSVNIGGWTKTLGVQSSNIELSSREDCYAKPLAGTVPTNAPVLNPSPTNVPIAPNPIPTSDGFYPSDDYGFDPSDNCEDPDYYRDGYCDSTNNVAACEFDGGDCCPETCVSGLVNACGANGYNCIRSPSFAPTLKPSTFVPTRAPTQATPISTILPTSNGFDPSDNCEDPDYYRDGYCDSTNNVAACEFDGGDCCPETCVSGLVYACGANGYNCIRSPSILMPTIKPSPKPTLMPTTKASPKPTLRPTTKPSPKPTLKPNTKF